MKQKHFLLLGMAALLVFTLFGCGLQGTTSGLAEYNDEPSNEGELKRQDNTEHAENTNERDYEIMVSIVDDIGFYSLEDFLNNYNAAKSNVMARNMTTLESNVNLSALETLYFPVNIPEEYPLYKIIVSPESVSILFVHQDYLDSEDSIMYAIASMRYFRFGFTRWNLDTDFPMEGTLRQNNASKEEYLDRGYIFAEPNLLFWSSDSEILMLYLPLPMTLEQAMAIVTGEIDDMQLDDFMRSLLTVDESQMQALTETIAVNLRDSNEVFALLDQVTQHSPGDRSALMESTIEGLYITDTENIDECSNGENIYDTTPEYEPDEANAYNNGDTTEDEEQSEEQAAT